MTDKKNLLVSCPRCGVRVAWQDNPFRPFCSDKCRMIDLGRWANEDYRIPAQPTSDEELAEIIEFPQSPEED
ncbi:MAG: DNA gyrase inhibitor YacG [Desulfuromonadales bacterium]|jgi:endogenous inhibitor of DNA gyrase (YacG/DUF329 family)